MKTERVQDIVIGAGAVGVACAHALAASGRDVLLVDKGTVCSGCSHGNAGWVTPCHSIPLPAPGVVSQGLKWMLRGDSPFYIKPRLSLSLIHWLWHFYRHCNTEAMLQGVKALADLNQDVVALTNRLVESESLDCEFQQRGLLALYATEAGFEKGVKECELLTEVGLPGKVLDRESVHRREPALNDAVCGGVFFPSEADFVPDRFVKELADCLPALGVQVLTNTTVEAFDQTKGKITSVVTSAGSFEADNMVLAAGSWSVPLARKLGIKLPIQPGKGYSLTLDPWDGMPKGPLYLAEIKVGVTPWRESIRLAGTMELAGFGLDINQRRVDAIVRGTRSYLTDVSMHKAQEVWAGLRPVTFDGLPIIGRSDKITNLFLATGHGMLGLTQSVATGKLIAQLVAGEEPFTNVELFSPSRF